MAQFKIISIGGSIIIPATGFDVDFLKKFKNLIVGMVKKGEKFILVVGGGATCRMYQDAAKRVVPMTDDELDWLGIKSTMFNAEFVRTLFKDIAHKEIITDPTKKIKTNKSVIVAAGWKPGCSTDYDAVLLAKTYGATEVINASNIDYIYTADPKKDPTAKPLPQLTWKEAKNIIGEKWSPGANVPFDPKAVKTAEKLKLSVKFVKGSNIEILRKTISGEMFQGTTIK